MQLSNLAQDMAGSSGITNGWDAVVAIDLDVVNALFQQQYVTDSMDSARRWLQISGTTAGGATVLMVGELGPPLVSFAASNQVTLSMRVVDGRVVVIDSGAPVYSLTLPAEMCVISATVPIVAGTITAGGSVVADFTGGTYTLSPATLLTSDVSSALNDAINANFQQSGVKYTLGSIDGTKGQKPLLPADFTIATQSSDETGEAAVLLLVNCGSGDGTAGALPYYPIPDPSTASIVIDRNVIAGMIQSAISADLPSSVHFLGTNEGIPSWQGTLDAGALYYPDTTVMCSELYFDTVTLNLTPGSIYGNPPGGANLYVSMSYSYGCIFNLPSGGSVLGVVEAGGQLLIEPVVAADGSLAFQYTSNVSDGSLLGVGVQWYDLARIPIDKDPFPVGVSATVLSTIATAVQKAINLSVDSLKLPAINVFALQSLIFPEQAPLTIQAGYLIYDLLLPCTVAPQLTVAPSAAPVAPGDTMQFTATQNGSAAVVDWSALLGTIDSNGNYTAPTTDANGNPLRHSELDQVTAMLSSNNDIAGDAIAVVIAEGPASFLSPVAAQATAGSSLPLAAMDANGNPLTVAQWTLTPNVGSVVSGTGDGMYVYNAPQSGSGTITISAKTSDGTTASIQVGIGYTPLQVSSSSSTLEPGQTFTLNVSGGTSGAPYLWWVTGGGTVTPNARNSATATYTAPWTLNGPVTIMVSQPDTGAFGTTVLQMPEYLQLTVTSSSSTIAPGGTCTLTALGGEAGVSYQWHALQGTVSGDGGNTATYAAPAVFESWNPVTITVGQGTASYGTITLQKASS